MKLSDADLHAAVLGGAFYGGGGGGLIDMGFWLAEEIKKAGQAELLAVEEIDPSAILVTCSMVGAPAASDAVLTTEDFLRCLTLLEEAEGAPAAGVITNEAGAVATINGWLQSAVLGIPVIDAPANGRAHPTGTMGSMGLDKLPDYLSVMTACGGRRPDRYTEITVRGRVDTTAPLIRQASIAAGGMVAVCRNPVTAGYAGRHGAPGSIMETIRLGRILEPYFGREDPRAAEAAAKQAKGRVLFRGTVVSKAIHTAGGFDTGLITMHDGGCEYRIPFWNEYLAVCCGETRLAEFPDLIVLMDEQTNEPLTSAKAAEGIRAAVIAVPEKHLLLGSGMDNVREDPQLTSILAAELGMTG